MKLNIKKGRTSYTDYVFIQDSRSSSGAGLTGLVFNTASLTAYYVLQGVASAAITLATQTVTGAWATAGFVEVDATHMPGVYRIDYPNIILAAGSDNAVVYLQGAANMVPLCIQIALVDYDPQSGTNLGLSLISGDAYARIGAPAGASVSADVAAVKTDTGTTLTDAVAIKAKTDSLAFTVAGQVDANTKSMNSATMIGTGAAGDLWRGS